MRKNEKITALYERLSRDDFGKDDDQQRESNSISNQKAMLEEFAARQGFTNIVHFTDDGISGTCFDRPGFLAMMKEVEAGNVEYLCIKDMSRMGRDYLKVGQIMEILRQRGVRLIAINDGVDSARGDDDFIFVKAEVSTNRLLRLFFFPGIFTRTANGTMLCLSAETEAAHRDMLMCEERRKVSGRTLPALINLIRSAMRETAVSSLSLKHP